MKTFMKKLNTAMTLFFVTYLLPVYSYASGPDLSKVDEDATKLLEAPSSFKKIFYSIAGLLIFVAIGGGIIKLIQASSDMEKAEAKKALAKVAGVAIGIPMIISIGIALVSWRLGIKIKF